MTYVTYLLMWHLFDKCHFLDNLHLERIWIEVINLFKRTLGVYPNLQRRVFSISFL